MIPLALVKFRDNPDQRSVVKVEIEDGADAFGFEFIHHQLRAFRIDVVPKERHSANPCPFATGRCDFVPGPFQNDLSFELREGQQYVQHQPPHGIGSVEQLRD